MIHPKLHLFKYLLLALLMYVPIFGFLDSLPIRVWDESRIAVNAIEMYSDGDYIVTHFNEKPETWNTKPPLLIWSQVLLMKLIGVNEVAIRLPTSISIFLICLALVLFCERYFKNFWLAFISILVLITSFGFMSYHISRTGDYDAMLTLFTFISCLFFYTFCETGKTKFIYWFFFTLTLGVLTKGIAALLFGPAMLLFALFQKKLLLFLKNKHFYFGLAGLLFFGLGYYFLRESMDPGYIDWVLENEMGGRFLVSQGNQKQDFWFYYNNFLVYRLADRYLLIPCGIILGFLSKDPRMRRFTLFTTLASVSFFLIISSAKTHLEWYDAPLYPFISLIIGFSVFTFFDFIKNSTILAKNFSFNIFPYLFLFLIFTTSYRVTWSKTYAPNEFSWDYEFFETSHYLQEAVHGKVNLDNKHILYDGYNAHLIFYTKSLKLQGITTTLKVLHQVNIGDVLIVSQGHVKNALREKYICKEKDVRWPFLSQFDILDFKKIDTTKALQADTTKALTHYAN